MRGWHRRTRPQCLHRSMEWQEDCRVLQFKMGTVPHSMLVVGCNRPALTIVLGATRLMWQVPLQHGACRAKVAALEGRRNPQFRVRSGDGRAALLVVIVLSVGIRINRHRPLPCIHTCAQRPPLRGCARQLEASRNRVRVESQPANVIWSSL